MLIYLNKKVDKKIYYYEDSDYGSVYGSLKTHLFNTIVKIVVVPEYIGKSFGYVLTPQKDINKLVEWYRKNPNYEINNGK